MADKMDQLFNDIMSECESERRLSRFSGSVRDRLNQYERKVRKQIVSRKSDNINYTPLFYACENGLVEMVEYLILTCDADVEQRCYWGRVEESVTPLWCAARICDKPMVECLVRHGAEVNAIAYGTTPVKIACLMDVKFYRSTNNRNLDVVKYLVEHGADINRANDHGQTCLMVAVNNCKSNNNNCKSNEIFEFLLKNGAYVDARDESNRTALHYAILNGMFDTFKLLLHYGADVTLKSLDNSDALQTACLVPNQPIFSYLDMSLRKILDGSLEIFDYLVEHRSYSPGRLADANELMGACHWFDAEIALKYWRKAIDIRNSNTLDGKPLAKTPSMPKRDCYQNASEFTSLAELDVIALNLDALMIQSLLIHERILGEHTEVTFNALRRIGTNLVQSESFRYQICFDLLRRALEISDVNDSILMPEVAEVAPLLVDVVLYELNERTLEVADSTRDDKEPSRLFADSVAIFKLLTNRLVTTEQIIKGGKSLPWLDSDLLGFCYEVILQCIKYLIDLFVKTARTSEAKNEVRALVGHVVNKNMTSPRDHDTLLHFCVSDDYMETDVHMETFSEIEVTKLLLECGARVNARDIYGRTPLHNIASSNWKSSNQIVKVLLDHGAHLDTPDERGKTPAQILSAKPDNTVNLGNYTTLQCLAAQTIVKHEIQCDALPASANQFVDLHRQFKPVQQEGK